LHSTRAAAGRKAAAESTAAVLHATAAVTTEPAGAAALHATAATAPRATGAATLHATAATAAESAAALHSAAAATPTAATLRQRLRMEKNERENDHCRCQIIESHDRLLLVC
jgi:hypothetical protein